MTKQPQWLAIANLGDVNPVDHGGFFVFVDNTGAYAPEAEFLDVPFDETDRYTVYRFCLDKCTLTDGILSDNQFHPSHPAWFAQPEHERKNRPQDTCYLSNVADSMGIDLHALHSLFCSDNPIERAEAYRAIGEYHGFENLDSYPLELTRSEARKRYRTPLRQLSR
jgi:hypothetical protein